VVVSSPAIHNVHGVGDRAKALRETARVLKKGGKLGIADIRHARVRSRTRHLRAANHRAALTWPSLLVRRLALGGHPVGGRD
jgi:ubiquinone/menaquinone biosynthesis C-methylase UbiE